ncbi:hypothetical protein [Undibacterium terreum]|uniref:Uncharacterized protein n=1 Tax=Undibacterium terreum TaxID=1224302 RepID=A0A916XDA4_9BURK|nr:hypothetical protein [Undibacterium terreum]GGC65172.1 hypothetical protein GCM10011396_10220 [Undibacterium terreum]
MDTSSYSQFLQAKETGRKAEATSALNVFISSFSSLQEREEWARDYLENEYSGHKVRHEIYQEIIFPVLVEGYRNSNAWCIKWLARTMQNLYQSKMLWEQVDGKTELQLLELLYSLCPESDETRMDLLQRKINWFRFSEHEWPAGILYGMHGASDEQCNKILKEVAQAHRLDKEGHYLQYLNQFEEKVREYLKRLSEK